MDQQAVAGHLARQDGVIARRQVLSAGGTDNDIQRLVRRREWAGVFLGVYVAHTGPLTDGQRAWAALLYAWPAALAGRDALHAHGVRGFEPRPGRATELVVPGERRVVAPPGVRIRRSRSFDTDAQLHLSPPRLRIEAATLEVASHATTEDAAVAVVADVCQSRRTTPARLLERLEASARVSRRPLLSSILDDVASGAYSALERRFLVRVERAHGLPTAARQRRVSVGSKVYFRDVTYLGLGTLVELDGRLGHDRALDRWADLQRDLVAARSGDLTVRLGWPQVVDAHRLAATLGQVLVARGWAGRVRSCGPDCCIP